jgi:SulP family sulfate permease
LHLRHDDEGFRPVTFAPGAVYGEIALLDRGLRSAPSQRMKTSPDSA